MAARSLFVAKHTPYVVFGQFPIMMFVKIKSSHPSQFRQEMDHPYREIGRQFL
jgi:hypothetical protein